MNKKWWISVDLQTSTYMYFLVGDWTVLLIQHYTLKAGGGHVYLREEHSSWAFFRELSS